MLRKKNFLSSLFIALILQLQLFQAVAPVYAATTANPTAPIDACKKVTVPVGSQLPANSFTSSTACQAAQQTSTSVVCCVGGIDRVFLSQVAPAQLCAQQGGYPGACSAQAFHVLTTCTESCSSLLTCRCPNGCNVSTSTVLTPGMTCKGVSTTSVDCCVDGHNQTVGFGQCSGSGKVMGKCSQANLKSCGDSCPQGTQGGCVCPSGCDRLVAPAGGTCNLAKMASCSDQCPASSPGGCTCPTGCDRLYALPSQTCLADKHENGSVCVKNTECITGFCVFDSKTGGKICKAANEDILADTMKDLSCDTEGKINCKCDGFSQCFTKKAGLTCTDFCDLQGVQDAKLRAQYVGDECVPDPSVYGFNGPCEGAMTGLSCLPSSISSSGYSCQSNGTTELIGSECSGAQDPMCNSYSTGLFCQLNGTPQRLECLPQQTCLELNADKADPLAFCNGERTGGIVNALAIPLAPLAILAGLFTAPAAAASAVGPVSGIIANIATYGPGIYLSALANVYVATPLATAVGGVLALCATDQSGACTSPTVGAVLSSGPVTGLFSFFNSLAATTSFVYGGVSAPQFNLMAEGVANFLGFSILPVAAPVTANPGIVTSTAGLALSQADETIANLCNAYAGASFFLPLPPAVLGVCGVASGFAPNFVIPALAVPAAH